MVPAVTRFAALAHLVTPAVRPAVQGAAHSLGLKIDVIDVNAPANIPGAFESAQRGRAEALIVLLVSALRPSILDDEILALHPPEVSQPCRNALR
jgi:hypothetical protein